MNKFKVNNNKYTGIYRSNDDITNLIIRVNIKEILNEFPMETNELESKNFRWQEKVYGKFERQFYKDEKHCITDLDKKYHDDVKNLTGDSILYTYVNEDEFYLNEESVVTSANVTVLSEQMRTLKLTECGSEAKHDYNYIDDLYKEVNNPYYEDDFEFMYIMVDFGDYIENSWKRSEHILCTLKYNPRNKLLLIYPDITRDRPYSLQINDETKTYLYFIENLSDSVYGHNYLRENEILNKIAAHHTRQQAETLGNFDVPPQNKLYVVCQIEILSAKNFESDNVYLQYFIDLPENWSCSNSNCLAGSTQSCRPKDDCHSHFGFAFEVALEYDIQQLGVKGFIQSSPYIYIEAISKDTWNRFRTEGLSYKMLPISQPGTHQYELQCLQIIPNNLSGKMKKFFIGDYLNYTDITWFAVPKYHEDSVLNKHGVNTIGTGQINLKVNVVHHSQALIETGNRHTKTRKGTVMEKLHSSGLVKSVEQVLEAFNRARKAMTETKKRV